MKIAVLGGGVIGTSTAYYLAKSGHEVTVIDRQPATALETSFANAGQVSPGYSAPWAAPGLPLKAIKWLFMRHRPLVIWPQTDPAFWRWTIAMLMNCTAERYDRNKSHMVRIAEYSRDCLRELRSATGISYDERSLGTLQLFRKQQQLDASASDIAILQRFNVPYELLDRDGCIAHEPALAQVSEKFVGGLRLPGDETGDCFKFTQRLAELARQAGVTFSYNTPILGLDHDGQRVTSLRTERGVVTADHYVMAFGSYSPQLLKPLGLNLPIYPVKGYSLTAKLLEDSKAPVSTVMDETYKIAITRLGDRIRLGGTAELAGYNLRLRTSRRLALEHVLTDLFPGGGDVATAMFWTGLRPMTPHGAPIIGPTRYLNLSLNTGHGTLGWTMAAGSGRVLADLISGRKPEIDITGLTF
ncbi:MAG TPA: D-amino acid dehydrogenase [Dongiaceae bacterium]